MNSLPCENEPAREELASWIAASVKHHQLTIITGPAGLGQIASLRVACKTLPDWTILFVNGRWQTNGYLSGFHGVIDDCLSWAEEAAPELVMRHEQTLKRILPTRRSPAYRVPKDLTNCAVRDERTRFYHYEYQNKLLVGLAEFLKEAMDRRGRSFVLIIDGAGNLSATSKSLISIISRQRSRNDHLRMVLLDREGTLHFPDAQIIPFKRYEYEFFDKHPDISELSGPHRRAIYEACGGNLRTGAELKHCLEREQPIPFNTDAERVADFYLSSLSLDRRCALAVDFIRNQFEGSFIARRNHETLSSSLLDEESEQQHILAMQRYRSGEGPLIIAYALAVQDKKRRIELLVDPCSVLMEIGLYDTWFSFFAPLFADPVLRAHGTGDEPVNGLFINAAFVLYAMGCASVSAPFIDEFIDRFPYSQFIPTALYAQSMTFGRYQIPVDLDRAEVCARRNLALIDESFKGHKKYTYIKVFAENAYAYIKARQGKFSEALALCERGNVDIVSIYGEDSYRLHRSILIYNTSQIYEIVGDHARAEARLREAIACDPYYAEYHNDLGNLLSKIDGREREAAEAYSRAIALSPPYYEAHLNHAMLLLQLGDAAASLAELDRVLEIKPNEWRAMREIGNTRLAEGNLEEALQLYNRALDIESHDADLHANLGLTYAELGNEDEAIHHYRSTIALSPSHATAHNNLAAELMKRGRFEEALFHADRAVQHSDDPDFLSNRDAIGTLWLKSVQLSHQS